jgi:UDP:flavonoid glycosyltransferase YjiC (YdhE family)
MQPVINAVWVVWEHGGQLGHLARLIPVVRALRAQGVPVVVATPDPAAVQPFFESTGVTLVTTPQVAPQQSAGHSLMCPADILLHCGFARPPDAQVCVLQWLALFDRCRPAAVLVDASPMAQYAAQVAGLRAVVLGHGFELPPALPGLSFAPWLEGAKAAIAESEDKLVSAMAALAQRLATGRAAVLPGDAGRLLNASRRALCTWPELDHFERTLPEPAYVGPIWHALPTAVAVTWPDKPGPKVLCYLTLQDKRHDFLWQALQKQKANVVVVSPGSLPWACDAARGWGITMYTHTLELDTLLRACDAVISNGGMGLTSMALHAGKPLMLLPTQLEQALLTYRLLQKGLVISTMRHQHQLQIQARVEQLLHDAGLKQRAARFASNYAWFKPQMAVDRVTYMLVGSENHTKNPPSKVSGAEEMNEMNEMTERRASTC